MVANLSIIFYKAPGRIVDKLIRWWTKSLYSHCEIYFPDGKAYSADAWDSHSGVRYKEFIPNPESWDFVNLELDESKLLQLREFCNYRVGAKYDWLGLFGFVIPFIKQDSKRWFCSEVCGAALKYVGKIPVLTQTSKLTPQGLYEVLTNVD